MESKVEPDRTILNNKPDTIIRDNEKGQREAGNIVKHKGLATEIQCVWT